MARRTSQGVVDGGSTLPSGTAQPDLPPVEAWGESNLDHRPAKSRSPNGEWSSTLPSPRRSAQLIRATRCGNEVRRKVNLNRLSQPVAQGAVSGMLWGSLIGLLFTMSLAGAAFGAASGALRGRLADLGVNDEFMRQAARTLQCGNAALFLLIRNLTTDKVLVALRGAGGTVMRSSFDESKEEALQATLAGARAPSAEAGS